MPPWEVLGGFLAGVATLVTALAGGARVMAEIREIRVKTDKTAKDTADVLAQQHTNGGSSMRDDLKRVLDLTGQNADAIFMVQEAQKRQDSELSRINRHIVALGERITMESAHTANRIDDLNERMRKAELSG